MTFLKKASTTSAKLKVKPRPVMEYVEMHQIGISITILASMFALYFYDQKLSKSFYSLSYPSPTKPGHYKKGRDDLNFVAFNLVLLTFLRIFLMEYAFKPAARWLKIPRRNLTRFVEQSWTFAYYIVMESMGLYIMVNSPFWFNTRKFWTDYPQVELPSLFKLYYLIQSAFWFSQLFVLHIEKRRKDHWQMVAHHVVTISLMYGSYWTNFTRVGLAIHVCMDFADILLSFAKMLKYLRTQIACDLAFAAFLISWVVTRHILFGIIIWSVIVELHQEIPYYWDSESGHMMTETLHWIYIVLLCTLEILICGWFYLICKVAFKVIKGQGAEDNRSSGEEDEDIHDEKQGGDMPTKAIKSNGFNHTHPEPETLRRLMARQKRYET